MRGIFGMCIGFVLGAGTQYYYDHHVEEPDELDCIEKPWCGPFEEEKPAPPAKRVQV